MADYVYTTELYHYGVKGMKWGVRRTLDAKKASYKKAKKEYNKAFNQAYNKNRPYSLSKKRREATAERWADARDKAVKLKTAKTEYKDAKKAYKADERAKAKAAKALKKMEKQQYKEAIKKRSKEILKGESAMGKVWDVLTDAHVYQAKIEYDIDKRAKTNKAWRD